MNVETKVIISFKIAFKIYIHISVVIHVERGIKVETLMVKAMGTVIRLSIEHQHSSTLLQEAELKMIGNLNLVLMIQNQI